MVNWLCPNCNKRMYSACDFYQLREINCIYCDMHFPNPFFRAPEVTHKESRV